MRRFLFLSGALAILIEAAAEEVTVSPPYSFEVTQLSGPTSTGAIVCGKWSNDSVHAWAQCNTNSVNSDFAWNYNPAWLPLPGGGDALMVRTQKEQPGPNPSRFALLRRLGPPGISNQSLKFEHSSESKIIFGPGDSTDAYGTEDPYVAFREKDSTYYLFYTAVQNRSGNWYNATLSLATCKGDPTEASCWVKRGAILAEHLSWMGKTCCGGILFRDDVEERNPYHYIFFGEGAVLMARTRTPEIPSSYELIVDHNGKPAPLLARRPGNFDHDGIEGGPSPFRLSDGNYIYFCNSAGPTPAAPPPPAGSPNYHPAWAVLNGSDPTQVLWRASVPLINVTQSYEIDGLTPWCIFLDSASRTPNAKSLNDFVLWYGGADTVVGARRVVVTVASDSIATNEPFMASVMV